MTRYRRLPTTGGAVNVRDLGGYAADDGRAVQFGRFVRSDNPALLSSGDVQLLKDYGIRTVIDLRSEPESDAHPHPLKGMPGIAAHQFSIADVDQAIGDTAHLPALGDIYVTMVTKAQPWLRDVLGAVAAAECGVMFNCTAGKDRTGIIAASLLSIAGVAPCDIVADYTLSRVYMAEMLRAQLSELGVFADAPPEAMQRLLDYLDANEGGAVAYLRKIGVTQGEIDAIRAKLLD